MQTVGVAAVVDAEDGARRGCGRTLVVVEGRTELREGQQRWSGPQGIEGQREIESARVQLILYNDSTIRAIGSEMHGQKKLGQMG
jgi:hypothetical protein